MLNATAAAAAAAAPMRKPARLINGHHGFLIQNYNTRSMLTVSNITTDHFGNYTCVAVNKLGTANASLSLNRKASRRLLLVSDTKELATDTRFEEVSVGLRIVFKNWKPEFVFRFEDWLEGMRKLALYEKVIFEPTTSSPVTSPESTEPTSSSPVTSPESIEPTTSSTFTRPDVQKEEILTLYQMLRGLCIQHHTTKWLNPGTDYRHWKAVISDDMKNFNKRNCIQEAPSPGPYGITGRADVLSSCWYLVVTVSSLSNILHFKTDILL